MSKEALKGEIEPLIATLETYTKKLAEMLDIVKRTVNGAGDGSNASAIDLVMSTLNHEFVGNGKMRPYLNKMHHALYQDGKTNLEAKLQAQVAELAARAPKRQPRRQKLTTTDTEGTE